MDVDNRHKTSSPCDTPPESKAALLAAVSDSAVMQSLAYLRVTHQATGAIRLTRFNPNFNNESTNQQFTQHIEGLQQESVKFYEIIMVRIFQGYPVMIRTIEAEFENTLLEFTAFLRSGSGPITKQDRITVMSYCTRLLRLCQNLPSEWGEIVSEQNGSAIGLLPEWLHTFDIRVQRMERDVEDKRKSCTSPYQCIIKDFGNVAANIYQDIRRYYAEQPCNTLDSVVCDLLSAEWTSMTYLIGISPPANADEPWANFKSGLIEHGKPLGYAALKGDLISTGAVMYFASAARAVVNEDGAKKLMDFESVWLAYGKLFKAIVGTFQINPEVQTRAGLLLDLEDAKEY